MSLVCGFLLINTFCSLILAPLWRHLLVLITALGVPTFKIKRQLKKKKKNYSFIFFKKITLFLIFFKIIVYKSIKK
jgi:hypothetical protein